MQGGKGWVHYCKAAWTFRHSPSPTVVECASILWKYSEHTTTVGHTRIDLHLDLVGVRGSQTTSSMPVKPPVVACIIVFLHCSPNNLISASQRTGVLQMRSLNHQICIYAGRSCTLWCSTIQGRDWRQRFYHGRWHCSNLRCTLLTCSTWAISWWYLLGGILVALLCLFMQKMEATAHQLHVFIVQQQKIAYQRHQNQGHRLCQTLCSSWENRCCGSRRADNKTRAELKEEGRQPITSL